MTEEEKERFGAGGVERAVVFFVQKACEAKTRNDPRWKKYLGWACHFLADALCPPHCSESDWWEQRDWEASFLIGLPALFFEPRRSLVFEAYFDLLGGEYIKNAKGQDSPAFKTLFDINKWVIDEARRVKDEYKPATRRFSFDVPYLRREHLVDICKKIGFGIRGIYQYVLNSGCSLPTTDDLHVPPLSTGYSATILVMDVSGSMASRWRGGVKIESAKKAALQFIEQVANEPRPSGTVHMIGVVTFSDNARLACPLTPNYAEAKKTIIGLGTLNMTNMGAGLDEALKELAKVPSGRRFIILLSDGMTNTGKSRDQILATSVSEARAKGICIYTVGFGDPGDIDEDFLKKVALHSGCGTYNYASSGLELFGTYIKVRHAMLGSNRIVDFASGSSPVRMLAGQTATLGAFQLTAPAQELHFTLAWSEPGRMQAILVDPNGKRVGTGYPGVQMYSGTGFVHLTVFQPKPGIWRASAAANTSFVQGVQYYGVVSARTGGIVIPYKLPTPCFDVLGTEICVPFPDLPTVLIVVGSIAILAWVVYTRLTAP
ncbi:MAG: VWA domain-containing protein [Candidatus Bipolaricaulota bacterium]|nr:VWA domain-containing protein [Candidatus Bipolaricaulota bacterium]MDW8152229.1 vWA domain-containing protein [Candidatus Bipolaricaulota bacterium]